MSKREAHPNKSAKVKAERGFSPGEVVEGGELIDVVASKTHPGQNIEVYKFNNYVWAVVTENGRLVSAWPSRKLKKEYGL